MKNLITLCFILLSFLSTLAAYSDTTKEMDTYSTKVREKISNAWLNQKPENVKAVQESKELIVVKFVFEIKKDGSVQNLKLVESSKIKELDDKVLNSVRSSLPFLPLPKGLDVLTINYGFRLEPQAKSKPPKQEQKTIPDEKIYKKDLDDYYKSVIDKIHSVWEKPNVLLNDTTRAIIGFEVSRNGTIKNIEVSEGSDFPELDESGLTAVKASAPFPPIPEKIPFDSIPIKYTFALSKVAVYDVNSPELSKEEKENVVEDAKKTEEAIKKYHEEIAAKINKGWDPPQDKYFALKSNIVEVEYYVLKNGELYRPNIISSSGDWDLDQSAIQTIEIAAPFSPLPLEIKTDRFKFMHRFILKQNY